MKKERFQSITGKYGRLRIAIVGDFCLDRYLEIDPSKQEISLETQLPVLNVVRVRSQPGAAGTILNNLEALGVGEIVVIGFCGMDGEGFELRRALERKRNVNLSRFVETAERRTFTYCKPLVMESIPRELNRLDSKNWTPTPARVEGSLIAHLESAAAQVDAVILMDQVDVPDTGVVTKNLLAAVDQISRKHPRLLVLADSRRGLAEYPPVTLKMNAREFEALSGRAGGTLPEVQARAAELAREKGKPVFVTLAEKGILGAFPSGETAHRPAFPIRGAIDIVGAGDSVTANLAAALAAGAGLDEALELASAASSIVIHQLGTTGTASVGDMAGLVLRD